MTDAYSRRVNSLASRRAVHLAVLVAALGYFVDIYDLILFGMVRTGSLRSLGIASDQALKDQGIYLFNMQMGGMLLGGILWGVLGDKRGRLSVLFGSITMYSLANIANGFVHGIDGYAACRLIAGIGLAGELGAGVTLVSEIMGRTHRGIGTAIVAGLGISGGLLAGWIGGAFGEGLPWRTAYFIGGGLGLGLLLLRLGVAESGMFRATVARQVERGNFFKLLASRKRLLRYLAIICVGVPIWYAVGILYTFSNDLGKALGLSPAPIPARVLFFDYGGSAIGGLLSGLLSQYLQSRRRALAIFMLALAILVAAYFAFGGTSSTVFYALCGLGGVAAGYWAVFLSTASELFGTNLRATVTTTVPNFVRGSAVLLTTGFQALTPPLGLVGAAIAVGVFAFGVGGLGLLSVRETFSVDLDFHEVDETPLPRATAA